MTIATPQPPNAVWQPQPGPQKYFFECPVEDAAFGGARGGGKSHAVIGIGMSHLLKYGEHAKAMIVRHSLPQLEDLIASSHNVYPRIGATWAEQKKTWTFPNKATLKFRFLANRKDASNYQGHEYTLIVFEELTNWPDPGPVDMLRATLRSAHGIPPLFRATCNPGGPGHEWVYRRYIEPQNAVDMREIVKGNCKMRIFKDPVSGVQRCFIPSRLQDNPALILKDPSYVQRLMDIGDPALVKAWLDGDWNYRPSGGIVRMEWFRHYDTPPPVSKIVISWDTANKNEAHNAYSVATIWGQGPDGDYLLDVYRQRVEFPELERAAISLNDKWRPEINLIEDKASGQQLFQKVNRLPDYPAYAFGQHEKEKDFCRLDKGTRLATVSGWFQSGKIFLPSRAGWIADYENEVSGFPDTAYADQCDSTSQYLYWAHGKPVADPRKLLEMIRDGQKNTPGGQKASGGQQVRAAIAGAASTGGRSGKSWRDGLM